MVPEPVGLFPLQSARCSCFCRRAKEKVKGGKAPKAAGETLKEEELPQSLKDDDDEAHDDDDDELDALSVPSPPQLHLITDATKFAWADSPVEQPPDSATFPIRPPLNPFLTSARSAAAANTANDPHHRRGSLPATAFPAPDDLNGFDPLLRRSSVDTSLQRLASNPFAGLARAKNTALYGPGFGVAQPGATAPSLRHYHLTRLPYAYPPVSGHGHHTHGHHARRSVAPVLPQYSTTRRLSMDSRQTRLAAMASPAPLTPYDAVIRASLPEHHLFALSARALASPIPGPLPSPGFSFGAASTPSMASPSSGDSERNSPDSLRSFPFRSEELDEDATSPTYDAYSRFGSIASVATSESSITSAYYADIGGPIAPSDPAATAPGERRGSWCVPVSLLHPLIRVALFGFNYAFYVRSSDALFACSAARRATSSGSSQSLRSGIPTTTTTPWDTRPRTTTRSPRTSASLRRWATHRSHHSSNSNNNSMWRRRIHHPRRRSRQATPKAPTHRSPRPLFLACPSLPRANWPSRSSASRTRRSPTRCAKNSRRLCSK